MDDKILKEFGLTSNEIKIFLALVKKGPMSATNIAKETGLNRPYIYYALERLLEKGYTSEIKIKGKKNFKSIDFNQIISFEEHKIDLLKGLVKDFEKIREEKSKTVSVEVLKGNHVVKNIFKMCFSDIKPKEEIVYIGIDEEKMEALEPIYLEKMLNYFKKKKITEKIILKKGGKRLPYAKTTEYRYLDPEIIGNAAKMIYQDKVIEIIYGEPIYAIIIQNKELAETEKKRFDTFWKLAKK